MKIFLEIEVACGELFFTKAYREDTPSDRFNDSLEVKLQHNSWPGELKRLTFPVVLQRVMADTVNLVCWRHERQEAEKKEAREAHEQMVRDGKFNFCLRLIQFMLPLIS